MPFDEGATVRLKTPVIEGQIADVAYDKATKSFTYLVPYTDENGEERQRWFHEDQLEVTAPAPDVAVAESE